MSVPQPCEHRGSGDRSGNPFGSVDYGSVGKFARCRLESHDDILRIDEVRDAMRVESRLNLARCQAHDSASKCEPVADSCTLCPVWPHVGESQSIMVLIPSHAKIPDYPESQRERQTASAIVSAVCTLTCVSFTKAPFGGPMIPHRRPAYSGVLDAMQSAVGGGLWGTRPYPLGNAVTSLC